jgi:hypothetical protein
MHTEFKRVSDSDIRRILAYCRSNDIRNGGLFEVYSTPGYDLHMVIVNSCAEDGPRDMFRPLGAFYCNYLSPGAISLEVEGPFFDGAEARKRHVAAVKEVVQLLILHARPGVTIQFNDLPALRF